jgi:isoleucyl-tRNA synthetase
MSPRRTRASRQPWSDTAALVAEELNVKEVAVAAAGAEKGFVEFQLKPNFRALGPKLGKKVQLAKQFLAKADASAIRAELVSRGSVALDLEGERFECTPEEIEVQVVAKPGYAAAGGRSGVVVVQLVADDPVVEQALEDEGLAREILSRVQQVRKDLSLGFTDRIDFSIEGSDRVLRVTQQHEELICGDALATRVTGALGAGAKSLSLNLDGEDIVLHVLKQP